jgi:S-adenosylmethionine:diacylglycerol 3-amino-3-carboxypropyl transferase
MGVEAASASGFFSRGINYSACNEDGRSELAFLDLRERESVCCILGGGERYFNLLIRDQGGGTFHLVDANPCQFHVLHLKIQAYLLLEYPDFCAFLGLCPCQADRRMGTYMDVIRPALPAESRAYWDREIRTIGKGIIYAGKFEKFMGLMGWFLSIAYGGKLRNLFQVGDGPQGQRAIRDVLAGRRWKLMTWLLCRKIWFRLLSGDPAFYAYPGIGGYRTFFKDRLEIALTRHPLRENFLLSLIFCGRYLPDLGVLPDCYRREHFQTVRAHLSRGDYRTHCRPLTEFLEDSGESFDCFSLSDVPSYSDRQGFHRMLESVRKRCRPQGRVIMRQLLTRIVYPCAKRSWKPATEASSGNS